MKKSYSEKLRDPRWQRKRLEILNKRKFECEECGETEIELHVHHLIYRKNTDPWDYEDQMLKVLCSSCHEAAEVSRIFLLEGIARLESEGKGIEIVEWLIMWLLDKDENAYDAVMECMRRDGGIK